MTSDMIMVHAQTYISIRNRGAIWVQNPETGKWYSDYKNPTKKFLMRFDEEVQKRITRAVRTITSAGMRQLEDAIEEIINAKR